MKTAAKKLRIGVVGVGYLGKFHAKIYANMDGVDPGFDPERVLTMGMTLPSASFGDEGSSPSRPFGRFRRRGLPP